MSLDDDVDLFEQLRVRLLAKLDAREEELAAEIAKARDGKRRVSGRGHKGSASAPGEGTQGSRVLAWLVAHPGLHAPPEIAEAVGVTGPSLSQVLIALHGAGLIERPRRGVYRHPVRGVPQLPPHQPDAEARVEPASAQTPRRETPADRLRRMQDARGFATGTTATTPPAQIRGGSRA